MTQVLPSFLIFKRMPCKTLVPRDLSQSDMKLEKLLESLENKPSHAEVRNLHFVFIVGCVSFICDFHEFKNLDRKAWAFYLLANRNMCSKEMSREGPPTALAIHRAAAFDHRFVLFQALIWALEVQNFLILPLNQIGQVFVDVSKSCLFYIRLSRP